MVDVSFGAPSWTGGPSGHSSYLQMVILLIAIPRKTCRWFLHCKKQIPNTEEKTVDHIPNLITWAVLEVSISLPYNEVRNDSCEQSSMLISLCAGQVNHGGTYQAARNSEFLPRRKLE